MVPLMASIGEEKENELFYLRDPLTRLCISLFVV